jgi:hypothetical protein
MSNTAKGAAAATAPAKTRALEGMIEVEPGVFTTRRSTSIFVQVEDDEADQGEDVARDTSHQGRDVKTR